MKEFTESYTHERNKPTTKAPSSRIVKDKYRIGTWIGMEFTKEGSFLLKYKLNKKGMAMLKKEMVEKSFNCYVSEFDKISRRFIIIPFAKADIKKEDVKYYDKVKITVTLLERGKH